MISLARAIVELGTLTTEKDALPMSFGEFQRGERVGGLSGLRYKDRQIAGIERHDAVAKFGRDIDFHQGALRNVRTGTWQSARRKRRCHRP
jgi:hypothetical protein